MTLPSFICKVTDHLSSVQSLSHVRLFATPWTAAHQVSLSITNSQSLLILTSIKSVMPSNHLNLSSLSPSVFNLSQHQGLLLDLVLHINSVQFSRSVVSNSLWRQNCSRPGLLVHHQLQESTQTHVHWVYDAIQPSHPLSSPFPPALNLSQH